MLPSNGFIAKFVILDSVRMHTILFLRSYSSYLQLNIFPTTTNEINYCEFPRTRQCIDQLTLIFNNEAPSKPIVYHWCNNFKCGLPLLTDKFKENQLLCQRIFHSRSAGDVGISLMTIYKVLFEHLSVKHIGSRWIPHNLRSGQIRLD